MCYQENNYLT